MLIPLSLSALLSAVAPIGVAVDSTLGCGARGSHEWLASRPSPLDSVTMSVGGTVIRVCYSRPSARGRAVDSLVPAGVAWRTGANEPTTVTLTGAASVGGAELPAGRYVLLTVPGTERWMLVFNTTQETDPARVFATLRAVAQGSGTVDRLSTPVDRFTIRAEAEGGGGGDGAALLLEWGDRRVRVPVRSTP